MFGKRGYPADERRGTDSDDNDDDDDNDSDRKEDGSSERNAAEVVVKRDRLSAGRSGGGILIVWLEREEWGWVCRGTNE